MQSPRQYSFIVPTYNSERWISSCINSILQQTLQQFDIIVLDSGSTDGTLAWLHALNHPSIRIYPAASRLNIVANWARATQVHKNEYMTIVGHDDMLYPGYLKTIDQLIEAHPTATLYQTQFQFIDANDAVIRQAKKMPAKIEAPEFARLVLQNEIEVTATGFMMRSNDYDAIGGIPPYPNLLYADIALWLMMMENSYLAVADAASFAFRFHQQNTSKSTGLEKLDAFELLVDFLLDRASANPRYAEEIKAHGEAFLRSYTKGACHKLLYVNPENRNGITMNKIILHAVRCAKKLIPGIQFHPKLMPSVLLAKLIDAIPLLRRLFVGYKSLQKRTY